MSEVILDRTPPERSCVRSMRAQDEMSCAFIQAEQAEYEPYPQYITLSCNMHTMSPRETVRALRELADAIEKEWTP